MHSGGITLSRSRALLIILLLAACVLCHGVSAASDEQYQYLVPAVDAHKAGDYLKAIEEFQKALSEHPEDHNIPFYIGLLYLRQNEPGKAAKYFKMTLEKDPGQMDARFNFGIALVQTQDYHKAILQLEEVYVKEPERDSLRHYLGIAYFQTQSYEKALYYFERAKTHDKNIETLALLYTEIAKQQLVQTREGGSEDKTITIDTAAMSVEQANILKKLLEKSGVGEKQGQRFNLELTAKVQYDDNVALLPDIDIFGSGQTNKKSLVEFLSLNAEYVFISSPTFEITAAYSIAQTIADSIRGMDTQTHTASLDFLQKGTIGKMPYNLRVTYAFDHLLLDNQRFFQQHLIRPAFILTEGPIHVSVLQYTFRTKDYNETPLFIEDKRDALNHEFGFVHYLKTADSRHYLKAGYLYETEAAKGDFRDYRGHKYIAGIQFTFPQKIRLNMDYGYEAIHYKNDSIFSILFGEKRKDREEEFTAILSKEFSKNLSVSLEYLKNKNKSNIYIYDYVKNVYSAGVTWKW